MVINEIKSNSNHISFRNSTLTHVLKDNLSGDSKALMFINISPDYEDMNQTKMSL